MILKQFKLLVFALAGFMGSRDAFGQIADYNRERLQIVAQRTIEYALRSQVQSATDRFYIRGEWPTTIHSTLLPSLLGVGEVIGDDPEASAFTTASIAGLLGRIYLEFPELQSREAFAKIPEAIHASTLTFERYGDDLTFNFYPFYNLQGVEGHRPVHMRLWPIYRGLTNVPDDADTTVAVHSALIYDGIVRHTNYVTPEKTFEILSLYRDIDRRPMFYNKHQNLKNTGAYMTWLYDEKNPAMPHAYFAKPKRGTRIPFNRNDVDCVVNANILKLKALAKKNILAGSEESCQMIKQIIQNDKEAKCAMYYPNTYNLFFTMATAEEAGDGCLSNASHQQVLAKLLDSQQQDGSWLNEGNLWPNPIISTAFAMYSLLHFGDKNNQDIRRSLSTGANYLLSKIKYSTEGFPHWKSNDFFTATALARSLVVWRSEAYTNLVIAEVLLKLSQTDL